MSGFLENSVRIFSSLFEKKDEKAPSAVTGNPLIDLLLKQDGDHAKETIGIKQTGEKQRESLFGELWESMLARYFPNISKIMDISSTVSITKKDVEAVPWQNEFETLTAFTLFVPDFLLKYITDPLANSETFLTILDHWPIKGKEMADKIRSKKDPDDVINALRLMHQDMITGKVTFDKVQSWI